MKYYEEVADTKLADDFYGEFRRCVTLAAEHPERVHLRAGRFKRVNLRRFPYNFLFREERDGIRSLVARHHAKSLTLDTARE